MARNSQKKLTKKTVKKGAKAKVTPSASSKASANKSSKPVAKKASKAPAQKAKKLAKIKSTGGYGFAFEDKVAGQLLIRMLNGLEPWNIKGSRVERLSFQVGASGWKLDDLLLEMRNDAGPLFCSVNLFLMPGHSGLKGRRSIRHGTTWLWWWDVYRPMLKQRGKTSNLGVSPEIQSI